MNTALLSVITDEVSDDLETALNFAKKNHLKYVELRTVAGKSLLRYSDDEIRAFRKILKARGFQVISFASPILKWQCHKGNGIDVHDRPDIRMHGYSLEPNESPTRQIERAFEVCRILGTSNLRVFSFLRFPQPEQQELSSAFSLMRKLAETHGIRLLLEHEKCCHIATCQEVEGFLKQFGDPRVGILLDPGNFLEMGETSIPQTWLGRVGLVHIKDYDPDQKKFAPLGQGGVDFAAYFRALQRHGCDTLGVSLETHCPGDKLGSTQASLDALRRLLKSLGIAEG